MLYVAQKKRTAYRFKRGAKHLRKFWRRQFWKGERIAGKKLIKSEKVNNG